MISNLALVLQKPKGTQAAICILGYKPRPMDEAPRIRKRIYVRGIVQGVGFRPFVYRIAHANGLAGWVRNSSEGVFIEVEGSGAALARFVKELGSDAPKLAQIDSVTVAEAPLENDFDFAILDSAQAGGEFVLVPPDAGTCDDCVRDFSDPVNRRYGYPFTNCTNCGPRYSIIIDIPYDRPATTMAEFQMCAECQAEYENPADRRFDAQPNACPVCGPSLSHPLETVRQWLRDGKIVAIKGLGGFHLACDAMNDDAVRRLRERKRRSDKPFALMARDMAAAKRICVVSDAERDALLAPGRPIVILQRRSDSDVSDAAAPGNVTLGVMLPYTPLHYLLFSGAPPLVCGRPPGLAADESHPRTGRSGAAAQTGASAPQILVMTSGNVTEEPIVSLDEELPRIAPLVDVVVTHNRKIHTRVDDSVVRVFDGSQRVLRRSRGFAPQPITLGFDPGQVLGVGGELKNTFCLTKNGYAILSQHIGDLENYETLEFFNETLDKMKRFFRIEPEIVAYDLHPGYLSTRFAQKMANPRKIGVQHHHAHIASCMAENGINETVIGVAFDGTGYGTDGQIWGGEVLTCDFTGFERRMHLRYIPLVGGDAAVREPWRAALAYVRDAFGNSVPEELFARIPARRRMLVETMLNRKVNTILTSSCGRLFDAVAFLVGLRDTTNYEGQAAIELEAIAEPDVETRFGYDIADGDIDMRPAVEEIVRAVQAHERPGRIAAAFHNTVAAAVIEACSRIRETEKLNAVCLSGGTFQNFYLLRRVVDGLRVRGFAVHIHAQVPANDGGIALGQAVIAGASR